jgi:hypothetical protein
MGYQLEGRLLEVCSCNVLCPCWVGEDPDGGECDGVVNWHVDKGTINRLDVSGLTVTQLNRICRSCGQGAPGVGYCGPL